MLPNHVKHLSVTCNLSECALEEALIQTRLVPEMILYVSPQEASYARKFLRQLGVRSQNNGLIPYITLIVDERLMPYNWYLSVNGVCVGSPGI